MSQDQVGPLLQVLPHFLTSKSLFWCNLPLTILYEHPLDSRLLLCIILNLLPSNCCFFFNFPLFGYFFSFLIITITFSLINLFHLLLAHAFSLVFIDFTLLNFLFPLPLHPCFFFDFHMFFVFFLFLFEYFSLIFL